MNLIAIATAALIRPRGSGYKIAERAQVALVLGVLSLASGATAQELPAFEVATVRRSPPPQGDRVAINLGDYRNGRVTFANVTLSDCLKYAFGLVSDDQIVGPDWIKSIAVRFDIVAEPTPGTSRDRVALMLQRLLAERLGLKTHVEQKPVSHLELIVAKNGPHLTPAERPGDNLANAGRIDGTGMTMQGLATLISRFERQTVVDKTSLTGQYKFHLEWTPAFAVDGARRTDSADAPAAPSIYTALQEQLGLKLQSGKGPIGVLVIDYAEQTPADN